MDQPELSKTHDVEIENAIKAITKILYENYTDYLKDMTLEEMESQDFQIEYSLTDQIELLTTKNYSKETAVLRAMIILVMRLLDNAADQSALKKSTEAWTYISKAEFWSGCIFALCNITKDIDGSILLNNLETAKKGGKAKSDKTYGALKAEVCRLFTEKRTTPWSSCNAAAQAIYSKIKSNNPEMAILKENEAAFTVSNWIKKEIPNYQEHISRKQSPLPPS